jgi:hypothetical protein
VIDGGRILRTLPRTTLARGLAVALSLALSQAVTPAVHAAPAHLVDPSQVTARLIESAQTREAKIRLFQDALATPEAQAQARRLGRNPVQLKAAVAHLSDKELQDLSQRATRVKDVAAGHGTNDSLAILGLVLLVAGVVVLLAVANDGGYYDDCYCY